MKQPILNIIDLLSYQTGAIVSKEIARKPTGTVTLFAFDDGQGLSEHTAPFDAIVQIVEGQANVFIDAEPYPLMAGQMIIIPAQHSHALQARGPFKMILTMIRS